MVPIPLRFYILKGERKMNNLSLFLKKNSSTILTVTGAVGVVATTVTAVKATPKALELLKEAEEKKGEKLTTLEKVKVAGPVYIPSAAIGLGTLACVFGANALNKKQQASLISAYALLENSYKQYKGKITEVFGEDAHAQIKTAIVEEELEKMEEQGETLELRDDEECMFFEYSSMQRFGADPRKVEEAEEVFNAMFAMKGYASLNDFLELIGAEPIDVGNEVGWTTMEAMHFYGEPRIDFIHDTAVLDDGMEVIIISCDLEPSSGFMFY